LHEQGGKDYTISEIIMHPDYDKPSIINNDIALLKINGEFDLSTPDSDIIKLPAKDSELSQGTIVTVTGWGYLVNGGGSSPATLQTVDVPVVDRGYCAERNNHVAPVTNAMFCAGVPEGGKDACQVRT
jgi:trypsin